MRRAGRARRLAISRWTEEGLSQHRDNVASEEPLEIRLVEAGAAPVSLAVTMRTPGHDFELVAGFLLSEGLLEEPSQVARISYCKDPDQEQAFNIVNVYLRPGLAVDPSRYTRNVYTTSSCGVCGKTSLELVETRHQRRPTGSSVAAGVLRELPSLLNQAQEVFSKTGGLHASGLFSSQGELLVLREDVGRHNATDKVLGRMFLDRRLPADDTVLVLSGRASFELVQKAVAAGIPVVCALGAPSTLAVDLARRFGLALIGFLSRDRFNVYAGRERIGER